jgi:hypothetical protein
MPPRRNRSCANSSGRVLRLVRRMLAIFVASVAMLTDRPCCAQRVVLVQPSGSDVELVDAFNRLHAELSLQLFDVVVDSSCDADSCKTPIEAANQQNATAAIALHRQSTLTLAEIATIDRATGKPFLHELQLESGPDTPAVIAIRAVDLLRSRLRDAPAVVQKKGDAPPRRQAAAVGASRGAERGSPIRPASVRIGATLLEAAPGLSPAFGIDLAFDYLVTARLRLGVQALASIVGGRYRGTLGTAIVRQEMAALRAGYAVVSSDWGSIWPSLGIGTYHLEAHGEDVLAPFFGRSTQLLSFAGSFGLACALRLSRGVALEAEGSAIFLTRRPEVAVYGETTPYRRAVYSATIGARVSF